MEDTSDYYAMQYLLEDGWDLLVTKSVDSEVSRWRLQQKMSNGQLRDLVGSRRVYLDKYSKHPKIPEF